MLSRTHVNNYLSSSDLTRQWGSLYFVWDRSSGAVAPAAQVTYTNSSIDNDNYHVIVYEASSSYSTWNGNYDTPTVERRYIVQSANKKRDELRSIRENFTSNQSANRWLSNVNIILTPENIKEIKPLFREVYDVQVESTSKCNYSHKNEIHPKIVIIKRKINKDLQTLK